MSISFTLVFSCLFDFNFFLFVSQQCYLYLFIICNMKYLFFDYRFIIEIILREFKSVIMENEKNYNNLENRRYSHGIC